MKTGKGSEDASGSVPSPQKHLQKRRADPMSKAATQTPWVTDNTNFHFLRSCPFPTQNILPGARGPVPIILAATALSLTPGVAPEDGRWGSAGPKWPALCPARRSFQGRWSEHQPRVEPRPWTNPRPERAACEKRPRHPTNIPGFHRGSLLILCCTKPLTRQPHATPLGLVPLMGAYFSYTTKGMHHVTPQIKRRPPSKPRPSPPFNSQTAVTANPLHCV